MSFHEAGGRKLNCFNVKADPMNYINNFRYKGLVVCNTIDLV